MSFRLSIIIPFYNVEQYIAQCLDSVFDQDIPLDEYEVICVNDGSPDHSRDIVLDYMKRYPNLRLVEHEHNKKLGAARNTGRKAARGKYIWNVDSDDMIAPNCLGDILQICEKNELDLFLFGLDFYVDGNFRKNTNLVWVENDKVYDGIDFWHEQGIHHISRISPVWTQVYNKSFLDDNKIYSPEINMGEDVPYSYSSILLSKRMMAVNKPYYIYRSNSASLTAGLNKKPSVLTVYENGFVCSKCLFDYYKKIQVKDEVIEKSIKSTLSYIIDSYVKYAKRLSKTECFELRKLMMANFFKNRFVFGSMSCKKSFNYLLFLCFGKLP